MSGFQRHKENSEIAKEYEGTPWKDRGYVAWLGWGGTEGIEWASNKLEEIRNEELNKTNKKDFNMKNKKLIFRDYKLKDGDMITIDGDMAIGSSVFIVKEDGTRESAPEGEYMLEDGTTLFVDAEGYINEVRTAATSETEEEMGKDKVEYQVTPEEVMAVVNPIFEEMRTIIGELQARVDMLEGNMPKHSEEEEMEEFSRVDNLKFRLSRIRGSQV